MDNKKYMTIHITAIVIVITFMLSMIGVPLSAQLVEKQILEYIWLTISLVILGLTFILMLLFVFVIIKTKLGKAYDKEYVKRRKARIDNQRIEELTGRDYSTLPRYHGDGVFTISKIRNIKIILWFNGIISMLIILIFLLFVANVYQTERVMLIMLLPFPAYFFFRTLYKKNKKKILISEDGVRRKLAKKNNLFKWSKIKTIGISVFSTGKNTRFSYIYITKRKIKSTIYVSQYKEKNDMILLKYRSEVIHAILEYWQGNIVNLDTQKSWLEYINRLPESTTTVILSDFKQDA